jgi:hypothetical protein
LWGEYTVILLDNSEFYTCGDGGDGRLEIGSEDLPRYVFNTINVEISIRTDPGHLKSKLKTRFQRKMSFPTLFNLRLQQDGWRNVPENLVPRNANSMGYLISRDGRVQSTNSKYPVKRRILEVRKDLADDYDLILMITDPAPFTLERACQDEDVFIDVPRNVSTLPAIHELHLRSGAVRHKGSGRFASVSVSLSYYHKDKFEPQMGMSVYLLLEKVFFAPVDVYHYEKYLALTEQFSHLKFESLLDLDPTRRDRLLCITRSDLLHNYLDEELEVGDLHLCSVADRKWGCLKDGSSYIASPVERVRYPCACPKCRVSVEQRSANGLNALTEGHSMELFIRDLLISHPGIEFTPYEPSNRKYDDVLKLVSDGTLRTVQYKKLIATRADTPNTLTFNLPLVSYPDQLPILASNADHTRFFAARAGDIHSSSTGSVSVTFTQSGYHHEYCYTNVGQFLEAALTLLSQAPQKCDWSDEELYGRNDLLEYRSIMRAIVWFDRLGIDFKGQETAFGSIDGYISMKGSDRWWSVQFKFTTSVHGDVYKTSSKTRSGTAVPYHVNDGIDFFIYEIGGYESKFLCVPSIALVKEGLIATDEQSGVSRYHIPPPDYIKPHWMLQYYNPDLLVTSLYTSEVDHEVSGLRSVVEYYKSRGHAVEFNSSNRVNKVFTVDSLYVKAFVSKARDNVWFQIDNIDENRPYCTDDRVGAFLLVTADNSRYLVPREALIYKGYIGCMSGEGKSCLRITDPWFGQFKDNFDCLFVPWNPLSTEPFRQMIIRLCTEAGHQAIDTSSGSCKTITVDGNRSLIIECSTSSVNNCLFNLKFDTNPYAFILVRTDPSRTSCQLDFYVARVTDPKIVDRASVSFKPEVESRWTAHRGNIGLLYPSERVISAGIDIANLPSGLDLNKLALSIDKKGYGLRQLKDLCRDNGISGMSHSRKEALVSAIRSKFNIP